MFWKKRLATFDKRSRFRAAVDVAIRDATNGGRTSGVEKSLRALAADLETFAEGIRGGVSWVEQRFLRQQ